MSTHRSAEQWAEIGVVAVVALLVGYFVRACITEWTIPSGNVLQTAATLFAAWWIQRVLRRRAELERIPIDAIAAASGRLRDLTNHCLDAAETATPTDGQLLSKLRLISNEIDWFRSLGDSVGVPQAVFDSVWGPYLAFKNSLTGGSEIEKAQAARSGAMLKARCLAAQKTMCKSVLEN